MRFGVIAKLDADLLEHRVGIALDQRQPFLVQHFVIAELAQDERHRLAGAAARTLRTPRRSARAAPSEADPASGAASGTSSGVESVSG
jgi:hypothetical protein